MSRQGSSRKLGHRTVLLGTVVVAAAALGVVGVATAPGGNAAVHASVAFAPRSLPDPMTWTTAAESAASAAAQRDAAHAPVPPSTVGVSGCADSAGSNVRVDIDCTAVNSGNATLGAGSQQSSAAIAVNPTDPNDLIATSNDYREGPSECGADFSVDGGKHWGGNVVPSHYTVLADGTRTYWELAGLSAVSFDTSGTAYLVCNEIDRTADAATAVVVFRSTDGGASWNVPGDVVDYSDGTTVAHNQLNKPWIAVDTGAHSPYRDRLYTSWVTYNQAATSALVSFAWSDDHGVSWHVTHSINGSSTTLCPASASGAKGAPCDNSQFPQPVVAPDGTVYVVFQNYNTCNVLHPECKPTTGDNHDQVLIVHSGNGGRTFSAPSKVADYYEFPDCYTYTQQDKGLGCLPTTPLSQRSVFEGVNYPSAVATGRGVTVTVGSYLNRHSNPDRGNCSPTGFSARSLPTYRGVGTRNGCNNDIVVSTSTDGVHFTGSHVAPWQLPSVNDEGSAYADQWWQWAAPVPGGGYAVSYYDHKYGSDQATGDLDISLRTRAGDHVRVTDQSLPPANEFPDTSGYSTFMGDYTGLAVGTDGAAHPLWMDTRNPIYTADPGDARLRDFAGYGTDLYTRAMPAG